jgi:phosphate starvation-inducible protein PhoH
MKSLSRSRIRKLKRQGIIGEEEIVQQLLRKEKTGLSLKQIRPSTDSQYKAFNSYRAGQNLLLHGLPGTGKTFISLYLALDSVLNDREYEKVYVIRSVVPTRDMGFLPGNQKDKSKVYELPYYNICNELFGRGDAYDIMKNKGSIEFMTTSFVRGITLNDCIVVIDEVNNMTFHELDSLITRMGDHSRLIMCGDFRQSDLKYKDERQGLIDFMSILERLESFEHVEFHEDDIVRSGLVREYIINKSKMGFV